VDNGPGPRTLWLEIDAGSGLISGRLGDDRGHQCFAGWLELAAALHSVIEDCRDPAPPGPVVDGCRPSEARRTEGEP
jgi:hypothetical protein